MRTFFDHTYKKEKLYCKHCSSVATHQLFSRQAIVFGGKISSRERLLGHCNNCREYQILFASDLRSLTPEKQGEFSCKIAGRGRIILGDWVYIPGHSRPGRVKGRFWQNGFEEFILTYEDGTEKTIKIKTPDVAGKEALISYKLLPFQLGNTLIGDYIYHVNRNISGKTVGVIHGQKEKIIIQLEDKTFLIMTLPGVDPKVKDNYTLSDIVTSTLNSIDFDTSTITINVSNGIVFLSGSLTHILDREVLIRFIDSLEGVLGVISNITIQPVINVSDDLLQREIHQYLFDSNPGILGVNITVTRGEAELCGYVEKHSNQNKIYESLASIDGLKEIHLKLEKKDTSSAKDQETTNQVINALDKLQLLDSASIKVHTINGVVYLEGHVHTNLQKSTATFAAMWAGKNLNLVNNLQVMLRKEDENQNQEQA
ncbi:MAG: BON domain-containing protein [Fibrobacterales bacterium]